MLAICSGGSLQKSDHEQITPIALKKRATWVIHLWFERITLKYKQFTRKSSYFSYVLTSFHCFSSFFLFLWVNLSCCSSLICSFLKSDGSELLLLLFTKERMWGNRSGHSWQKKAIVAFALFHGQIAHSLTKNERFDQKIYEQLPNPENYKPNWIPNFCFGNCSLK